MALNLEYTKTTDCKLNVYNGEETTLNLVVVKYISATETEEVSTTECPFDVTTTVTFTGDGVYKIYPEEATDEIHLIIIDCETKTNLNTIAQNVLCGNCKECDLVYYTSYHLAILSFYSKVETTFELTTVFDTIDSSTLTTIVDFMDILARIRDYEVILLNNCGCGCNKC